jgi:hypothetical protein
MERSSRLMMSPHYSVTAYYAVPYPSYGSYRPRVVPHYVGAMKREPFLSCVDAGCRHEGEILIVEP